MKILVDIAHPAHVHFYKHMIRAWELRGHGLLVVARNKEVTTGLLDRLGIQYSAVGRPSRWGRIGQFAELLHRDVVVANAARKFGADIIVTRNPSGVQAARLCGRLGVFDTDDGLSAGIHYQAARPFADYITSPDCLPEQLGRRHVRYPAYKQSAYLHPDLFSPDSTVLSELGLAPDARFFLVRFVAMMASHDSGHSGMPQALKETVIERLQRHGRVFLSCEGEVPARWRHLAYNLPPDRLHDVLAMADLVIGDSGTVPLEAAYLGTPSIHVSSYAGKLRPLNDMESKYGLAWSFRPQDATLALARMDELLESPVLRNSISLGHGRMLEETVNLASWYVDFVERLAPRRQLHRTR